MNAKNARLNQPLIPFDEALSRVIASVTWKLAAESVAIKDARGRVLREDVRAGFNIPPFDKSAMDGYAVKAADVKRASERGPVSLEVIEDLPAGKQTEARLKKGEAARIMTGAPLIKGADAVVMVEYTDWDDKARRVLIKREVRPGENAGKAGEDVKKGELVARSGLRLGPADMGMLAALGKTRVKVSKRPAVAVISTGNEVQAPGRPLKPGQIYDANGYSLVGLALSQGCKARFLGSVRDRPEQLTRKIAAAKDADLVLMTGGVSVGDYDFVTDLLRSLGIKEIFYKAQIKPGKPTFAGKKGRRLFFGLPGNPVSAMVCCQLFVRPAIDLMTGKEPVGMRRGKAVMDVDFRVNPGRRKFLRGALVGDGPETRVRPYPNQKSGVFSSMVAADALIDVPGEVSRLEAGDQVDVWFLRED